MLFSLVPLTSDKSFAVAGYFKICDCIIAITNSKEQRLEPAILQRGISDEFFQQGALQSSSFPTNRVANVFKRSKTTVQKKTVISICSSSLDDVPLENP